MAWLIQINLYSSVGIMGEAFKQAEDIWKDGMGLFPGSAQQLIDCLDDLIARIGQ